MKKIIFFPMCSFLILLFLSCNTKTENKIVENKPYNEGINITPTPQELIEGEGQFTLSDNVVFVSENEEINKIASFFADKIKYSTGYNIKNQQTKPNKNFINLELNADLSINDEGYLLEVNPEMINIQAKKPQGIFYGMQTLMQLLPAEIESPKEINYVNWNIPSVKIKDQPRFHYRGVMLDVSRHFVDIEFIKKQLDVLAIFKINKFHWHLTDDQGWRIEIKKYPKLMEISSKRIEGEGNTYGPYYYTQEQIKEVVAYAKERFIEVIPEIELPGHSVATLSAYPELSCTGKTIEVRNIWGVATDVYCAGNEDTFKFLEDVLTEIIPLFESDYIHIGGDECLKIRWKDCPKCQARIKELGLKTDKDHSAEARLQSYFVQRMEKFLISKNKKIIGWDEILEGGLSPSATVMSWQGEEGGIAAANMGNDVIMTPGNWLYIDKYQGDSKINPVTIGGLLTLQKVYGYEPIPVKIDENKRHHILGAQVNMWNEYNYKPDDIEYDIYPRVIALAELSWTPSERKNYKDFERRIDNQRVRLDMHNINYYIPLPEQKSEPSCNFIAFIDSTTLEFTSTEPVKMVYTTDGSEPTLTSTVYKTPLTFDKNTTLKIRSVLPSNKMSDIRTIIIEKQTYAPPVDKPSNHKPGLKAEYYKGIVTKASDLDGKIPDETEQIASLIEVKHKVNGYTEIFENDYYNTVLTGYINIPADNVYYFSTEAEELWLDGKLLISNAGEVKRFSRADKSIALAKGPHLIKIIRLSNIIGGWPPLWESVNISIRSENEPVFKNMMDSSFFK